MATIRESLEAAATAAREPEGAGDGGEAAEHSDAVLDGAGAGEASHVQGQAAEPVGKEPGGAPAEAGEDHAGPDGRPRDEAGRFAKGKPEAKPPKPVAPAPKPATTNGARPGAPQPPVPAPTVAPQPTAPEPIRAPQSWKPAAREALAKSPPEVQAEVARREKEMAVALQESAPAKRWAAEFAQVVAPYAGLIQAEGSTPMQMVGNLLQTAAVLRMGSPQSKAAAMAQAIKAFGVPIDLLDAALSGEQPNGGASPASADPGAIAQQVLSQVMGHLGGQQQTYRAHEAHRTLGEFSQGKEFFDDVRARMGHLLYAAAQDNRPMSLQDAYDMACGMDPEISGILKQRREAEAAKAAQASTQRARAAASSVRTEPAGTSHAAQPSTLREQLEAAMESTQGR